MDMIARTAAIVLSPPNARHAHASFGLRDLRANLGALRSRSTILEFVVDRGPEEIVERLLAALDGEATRSASAGSPITWSPAGAT